MKIGIVGYGYVGKSVGELFKGYEQEIYDPALQLQGKMNKDAINTCWIAFICVPTLPDENGACDTSIVEECCEWIDGPTIVIRSTVPPGTTKKLQEKYPDKTIIFQPEFVGETVEHPLNNDRSFIILGGYKEECEDIVLIYQKIYNASVKISIMSSTEAEMVKYANNFMVAAIVTTCNEIYGICKRLGISYSVVREGFLMNPTFSRYYTFVYPNKRGFGGKCLPKDLNAMKHFATDAGYYAGFVADILKNNERLKHD